MRTLAPRLPNRILLATDMTCHSDRAMDRAIHLAHVWQCEMVVVNIVTPAIPMDVPGSKGAKLDRTERARLQIIRDLGTASENASIRVEEHKSPADRLVQIADEENCDLIIIGTGKGGVLEKILVGTTASQIVRQSDIPVLMLRNRVTGPYANMVIASDLSEGARHVARVAVKLFPQAKTTLLHANEQLFGGLANESVSLRGAEPVEKMTDFLDGLNLTDTDREKVDLLMGEGSPDQVVLNHVYDNMTELVVVGSKRRNRALEALLGSMAERLVETLPSDILIVRAEA